MGKIPTAKEFYLKKKFPTSFENKRDEVELWFESNNDAKEDVQIIIEFAKIIAQDVLKEASRNAYTKDVKYSNDVEVDEESILTAYPLDNIK